MVKIFSFSTFFPSLFVLPLSSFSYLSLSLFIFLISHQCAINGVLFFFSMVGLNENKLDERIDINQQNLNNKTSNQKIEKTKTPIWTHLHKKNPKSPQKHQTTTNSNNKSEYESKKSKIDSVWWTSLGFTVGSRSR